MNAPIRCITAALAAALVLHAAAPAYAQTTCTANPCTVGVTASATVAEVMQLTLSAATTSLGAPTATAFDAGYLDAVGPVATVKSNRAWRVTVVGGAATFSYTALPATGLTASKPASDLLWGTVSGTYGNNMSASAQLTSGDGTAGASQQIFFRTRWLWATDVPGTYSLVVNFTLSSP